MKNKEFYKAKILECIMSHNCSIAIDKNTGKLEPCNISPNCDNCKLYARNMSCTQTWRKWLEEEHVEPILTNKEKAYIENIVKPFKNRVISVSKLHSSIEHSYVSICVKRYNDSKSVEFIKLPFFDGYEMYTGMVYERKYTIKDLGLFNDEKEEGGE